VIPTARFHIWQHSRAKERLIFPKERLDEKRTEYEREKRRSGLGSSKGLRPKE
jgi:hypothetical protein